LLLLAACFNFCVDCELSAFKVLIYFFYGWHKSFYPWMICNF
jgi:hypothetical protein